MRGVSGVVTLAIFTLAVVASTVFLVTLIAKTYHFEEERAVKAITGLVSPQVLVNITGCDSGGVGEGVLNITVMGGFIDAPREVIVVGVNGTIRSARLVNGKALINYPCGESFVVAFTTRSGALTFYTTGNDPLHSCITPPRRIVNASLLRTICDYRRHGVGVGTIRVLNAEKNTWYAIRVNGNPYCVFYEGNRRITVYQWDLDDRYIIFQSPITGPLYIVPCDNEEADYQQGFSTLQQIVPASILSSTVYLYSVASLDMYGSDAFEIVDVRTSVRRLIEASGGLVYRNGDILVPKAFLVINSSDLDEVLKDVTSAPTTIHYMRVEWNTSVLKPAALVVVNYWNPKHYWDPWRAEIDYSCLYGNCDDTVLGYVVDHVLTETMGESYSDIKTYGKVKEFPLYLEALTDTDCGPPLHLPKHEGYEWQRVNTMTYEEGKIVYRLPTPIYRTICALQRRAESRIVLVIEKPVFRPYTHNPKTYNIWGSKLVVIDNLEMIPPLQETRRGSQIS